ncbi:hypothetical protein QR98_0106290 [Sarcoptes scabiei]|uniref:Uncharacterized protein n=1 Tax=Sarcoptes scabiei TaxID=52283 RepID=A0A132AM07_SARSC|nr:hypothetical protein QR98_0106290 [Sarcoptes scabiei]
MWIKFLNELIFQNPNHSFDTVRIQSQTFAMRNFRSDLVWANQCLGLTVDLDDGDGDRGRLEIRLS